MIKNNSESWLKTLGKLGVDTTKLSFKELMPFKDVDRYLNEPVANGTKEWKYLIKSFRLLTIFSLVTIYENKFMSLSNCWNELNELFVDREIFDDELFVQSWVFCDFPLNNEKETILDYFEQFLCEAGLIKEYTPFIHCMRTSRLGLYQEVLSSRKTMQFKELFTNRIIKAENTIPVFEKGEIFLTRFVKIRGKIYSFGDPKCWPKDYKLQLENMVKDKLFYFNSASVEGKYKQFMKYAGPYWMSCVVTDEECPILQPDRYLHYLK
jgi:hypothetical protein